MPWTVPSTVSRPRHWRPCSCSCSCSHLAKHRCGKRSSNGGNRRGIDGGDRRSPHPRGCTVEVEVVRAGGFADVGAEGADGSGGHCLGLAPVRYPWGLGRQRGGRREGGRRMCSFVYCLVVRHAFIPSASVVRHASFPSTVKIGLNRGEAGNPPFWGINVWPPINNGQSTNNVDNLWFPNDALKRASQIVKCFVREWLWRHKK